MLVASVIPAEPSPWANTANTQNEMNKVNMDFNELIFAIMMLFLLLRWKQEEEEEAVFTNFKENSLGYVVITTGYIGALPVIFFLHIFQNLVHTRADFFLPGTKSKGLNH